MGHCYIGWTLSGIFRVIFDSKFTYTQDVLDLWSKATKILGPIVRIDRQFHNVSMLKLLYLTLVRSRLEYAAVVWNPIYQNHTIMENIQRRFLLRRHGDSPTWHIENDVLYDKFNLQSRKR